ncbi:MAG: sulfate permease [Deltaproteobacteria bacterium]|nr:sulfate permease [Deltaproteobacteria bacterium]
MDENKSSPVKSKSSDRRLLLSFFPFITWLKDYRMSSLRSDLLAGITVSVVLMPQAMAYAMLAGLPPVYGLYAAAVTPFIAGLWGSLRQLSTGPIAIMSLLVLTTLTPMAEPGSRQYIELAFLLALMVGIFYLGIGLFRLGEFMSFISHSTVKGFTSAAALIITATQLPHLLGIKVSTHEYISQMFVEIVKGLPKVDVLTCGIGITAFIIIYGMKKYRPNYPAGLIALVLTSVCVILFQLQEHGVVVVGTIPGGLPKPHLPLLDFEIISSLIGPTAVIALVSFAETYSVGKSISNETKQKVNVNQEFIGQGLANLIGSFFQGYPVSGSFSRTAINYAVGAKTGISSVVSSAIVISALLFFTPLFRYIPRAALAALVISAVLLLFHPKELFKLWKMNRHDGVVAISVFVLALVTKPDYALLIGVLVSLMLFLWKTMHPRIVRVTKDPEFNMFVNADLNNKPSCPQILQLRPDNAIYFANADYTVEKILKRLDAQTTPVLFLLLDFKAVGFIDITGIDELRLLHDELEERAISLAMMEVHLPVQKLFENTGFINHLKADHLIRNRGAAIDFLFQRIDHDYCKNVCPYSLFLECSTVK